MLESILLENFQGYDRFMVRFPPDLTLITGSNYSGKTRLLNAILFAFWGVSAVPGGSKLVPSRGHKPSDTKVIAQFHHDHKTYRIERRVASARLFRDDDMIASSTSAVNKELEEVLGVPQKFFLRLKYAEQSETQALLTLGAAELHKVIEHVSGASIVNRVIDRASKEASAAQAGLDAIGPAKDTAEMVAEEARLAEELAGEHQQISVLTVEGEALRDFVQQASHVLVEAAKWNAQQNANTAMLRGLQVQLSEARANHESARVEMASFQEEASTSSHLSNQLTKAREDRRKHSELTAKLQSLDAGDNDRQRNSQRAHEFVSETQNEVDKVGPLDQGDLMQRFVTSEGGLKAAEVKAKELEDAATSAVCPTCERPYEDKDVDALNALYMAQQRLMETLRNDHLQVEEEFRLEQSKRSKHMVLAQMLTKADGEVKRCDEIDRQANAAMEQMRAEKALIDNLLSPTQIESLQGQSSRATEAVGAVASAHRRLTVAYDRAQGLQGDIDDMDEPEPLKDTQTLEKDLQNLRNKEIGVSRRTLSATTAYGAKYSTWTGLKTTLQVEMDKAKSIKKLQLGKDTAAGLAKYLRTNRDRFMQDLWAQIMGFASNFASICTDDKIQRVERTPEGAFQFVEAGETVPIEAASGAQKSIMSLGVQLAMDTMLPDTFGALLLDEPTSQMDADRSMAVTQVLSQTGRQIIMVSHRELDATMAQSHIHLD